MRRTEHTHAALTHGSTDWAKRVLAQRQLLAFFSPEHIVGMEHYDFQKKHESELPFETMLARLGKQPEQCILVEDSHRNLAIPHAMGMETVLVHRLLDEPPPYVTHQFKTPELFMRHLHRQQPSKPANRLL
jgi:putative hydrolase of the HAD superfamily